MWQGLCYEIERQDNLKRMKAEERAKKRKLKKEICSKCKLKRRGKWQIILKRKKFA